jgi:hypothetical protein
LQTCINRFNVGNLATASKPTTSYRVVPLHIHVMRYPATRAFGYRCR